jgi:hypothetical protein
MLPNHTFLQCASQFSAWALLLRLETIELKEIIGKQAVYALEVHHCLSPFSRRGEQNTIAAPLLIEGHRRPSQESIHIQPDLVLRASYIQTERRAFSYFPLVFLNTRCDSLDREHEMQLQPNRSMLQRRKFTIMITFSVLSQQGHREDS